MTRKRAVKLLMARGYSRNRANRLLRFKVPGDNNFQAYYAYLRCERICDNIARLSRCFFDFGVSTDALTEALSSMSKLMGGK